MNKKTIRDIDIKGKRLLIRVDFNVPLDDRLNITDDTRIKAALPTIIYALENGAIVLLMSHLGRPDGKVVEKLRLNPVKNRLQELLGKPVIKLDDCIGSEVRRTVERLKPGDVALLENLRFHPEEEANDPNFSKELASLADIYINDAFGTAHRAHSSTEGIAKFLPAYAGFLIEKEIEYLGKVLESPAKPFALILGGAKISDKILVIENLIKKIDALLIGGGMAYTFLKAQGKNIGNSKLEKDRIEYAKDLLGKVKATNLKLSLPVDNVVVDKIDASSNEEIVGEDIPDGLIGVDIGQKTIANFRDILKNTKTILWNGPLGIFEIDKFGKGTKEIANFIVTLKATTVIGGGDTASAISKLGLENKMSHVSTGGGASLEFLEGKVLPGIACLLNK
ncbi:MAG: phosphoglycerate kinase [Candidatus Omnitrophica bacterium]|nr:phosphoglycerate kinase [Candidatus Omnitrophota bacterium]